MKYITSKPIVGSRGCSTIHDSDELSQSTHPEVTAGVSTGKPFTFGGVLFTPVALPAGGAQQAVTLKYPTVVLREFARSYCPPPSIDIAPATQAEAHKTLAVMTARHKAATWHFAAVGAIIVLVAALAGFSFRVAEQTWASEHCDSRVEVCR